MPISGCRAPGSAWRLDPAASGRRLATLVWLTWASLAAVGAGCAADGSRSPQTRPTEATVGEPESDPAGGFDLGQTLGNVLGKVLPTPPRHWLDVLRTSRNADERSLAYTKLADPKLYADDPALRSRMLKVYSLALQVHVEEAVTRAAVARSLAQFPGPEAQAALEKALADPSALVRAEAVRAMAEIRQPGGCEKLSATVVADADPDVRVAAAAGLRRFPLRPGVEGLIVALADDNPAVAHRAHQSLKEVLGQDFGRSQSAWRAYLRKHADTLPKTIEEAIQREQGTGRRKTFLFF